MSQEPRKSQQPDRLAKLQSEVGMLQHQVKRLELAGGFADSRTLSKRCLRIEQRLEKMELMTERHSIQLDFLGRAALFLSSALCDHLKDRHQVDLVAGPDLDAHDARQARRQLLDGATALADFNRRRAP